MTPMQNVLESFVDQGIVDRSMAKKVIASEKQYLMALFMDCYLDGVHYGKKNNSDLMEYAENYYNNLGTYKL